MFYKILLQLILCLSPPVTLANTLTTSILRKSTYKGVFLEGEVNHIKNDNGLEYGQKLGLTFSVAENFNWILGPQIVGHSEDSEQSVYLYNKLEMVLYENHQWALGIESEFLIPTSAEDDVELQVAFVSELSWENNRFWLEPGLLFIDSPTADTAFVLESGLSHSINSFIDMGARSFLEIFDGDYSSSLLGPSLEFEFGPISGFAFYGWDQWSNNKGEEVLRFRIEGSL